MTMTKPIDKKGKRGERRSNIIRIDKKERRKEKTEHKWVTKVRRATRIAMFRVVEAVVLFVVVSLICLLIGSTIIPLLAYEMSAGFGLTQSTNIYIAFASWILPMLFYTLLITAATFCVLKKFIKWLHDETTNAINKTKKSEMTEKESTVQ